MRSRTVALTAGLAMVLLAGCGKEWVAEQPGPCVFDSDCFEGLKCIDGLCLDITLGDPDGGVRLKEFGERCEEHEECRSTYCLAHPVGAFCTRTCEEGCPSGWECKQVPDPHGGEEPVGLCAVIQYRLCQACVEDLGCNVTGADLCLPIGDGLYCGVDCTFGPCPAGYTCQDVPRDPVAARQCLPDSDTCVCDAASAGILRGCEITNEHGACSGAAECLGDAGWSACSAATPAPEACNGADDDCDGFIDEDLIGQACARENDHGRCEGVDVCQGADGWSCSAPEPAPEACNTLDDDCDGQADEDFQDAAGRYVAPEHCGVCGMDCDQALAHATQTECRLVDGQPACRALACEPGFFSYDDGLACLALPANLCLACSDDEDCLAPGSRCVELDNERFCGRSCEPDSPYGPGCPAGYACQAYDGGRQCLPETGSCLCDADTVDTVRSCLVDTCVGYQTCQPSADGHAWTECNVEDFNVEICDGLDNNCNGQLDEGFLNPQTGRYESDQHCGFCNNDCSLYWTPEIHHVSGVCDLGAPGMPACGMGPCWTEVEDGTAYEWVDVNGDPDDGCECRRELGNTDRDAPDLHGEPQPGLPFVDENCDGVDGVASRAMFVRAGEADGDGSRERPFGSLAEALDAWPGAGKDYILVAEGRYDEDMALPAGVELHGGYAADFVTRDLILHAAVITGRGQYATLQASNLRGVPTLISGFVIRGRDVEQAADDDTPGAASVAVQLVDCDGSVVLRSNQILAGRAGDGGRGSPGAAGYGREQDPSLDGRSGRDGERNNGLFTDGCPPGRTNPGGIAGVNTACNQASGNEGATTVCPVFDWNSDPVQGAQAAFQSDSNGNGLGGWDWSFDDISGASCSHATESGFPTDIQLNVGLDGRDGQDGAGGVGGAGGTQRTGSLSAGRWVSAPLGAQAGTAGQAGTGGGGGGGGGGTAYYNPGGSQCPEYEIGPSGGGGGAGGCGGGSGAAGQQGGASIALLVVNSQAGPGGTPQLVGNIIQRGQGGRGGDGGPGGQGGLGGLGGFGGGQPSWISSAAGKGGDGANGGPGGGGGGGAGGPSFGLLAFGLDGQAILDANLFSLPAQAPTAGAGGAGGVSVGANASGEPGLTGAFGHLLQLAPCGAGGNCPAGATCDPNGVCVPAP